MKTIDIRRENFEAIFARVEGLRALCWFALAKHGPGTTRQIAEWTGLDLLTVRPRVTELCDLGFAYLADKHKREGVYAARDYAQAQAWHAAQRADARQLEMAL
jgi:hypothetical protein